MDPRITQRRPFAVLGVVTQVRQGSETPEAFADIWRKFESRRQEIESLAIGEHYFGVNFPTDKEDVTDYLAGIMVAADAPILEGLEKRTVSGSQFAVFECQVETIGESYQHIFTDWLPGATVQFNPTVPVFEEYPESTSQQPVRVHVPIRRQDE
ncbi:MAG: GyrI-like domain-containing protein [Leptolyngbyaceae cyanobacterium MO_188.B28]|nr:GyrI-like domain-containing protein [Leptolyngbyaceae cyanobacterium MO_188.B28]